MSFGKKFEPPHLGDEFEKLLQFNDDEFLDYVEKHSKHPGALFSRPEIARVFQMAGLDPPTGLPRFVRFVKPSFFPILKKAIEERQKLIAVGKIMDS